MEWPTVELDSAAEIRGGATPRRDNSTYWNGDIPWVTPTDLPALGEGIADVGNTADAITEEGLASCSASLLPPGTVLFSSRASIGKIGIASVSLTTNQGFANLIPRPGLESRYLAWCLHFHSDRIADLAGSTTFKEVAKSALKRFRIPIPPLSEQRRIVEILDQADHLRRRRADADAKTERILPALFIKMFGDPRTNPRRLPIIELGGVISEGPQNGLYKPASSYGKGTKILRIDGFYSGEVSNLDGLKRLKIAPEEIAKYGLKESDIVVNRVNSEEYLGKSAIIPSLSEPVVFESNMMRFTVDTSQVLPGFVVAHLQTSFTKAEILSKAKRAINQASINQQDVRSLTILLPPLVDQKRFVIASSKVRTLLSRSESERVKLEILFDSLIHRAFSGNITASWREARKKELLQEMEQQATALKKNYRGIRQ